MGNLGKAERPLNTAPKPKVDFSAGKSRISVDRSSARGASSDLKPPLGLFVLSVTASFLSGLFLFLSGFRGHAFINVLGVIVGMFIGLILMGLFRQKINVRQASGRFGDWGISSVRLGTAVSAAGWLLGLANLIVVAREISRSVGELP